MGISLGDGRPGREHRLAGCLEIDLAVSVVQARQDGGVRLANGNRRQTRAGQLAGAGA